MYIHPKTSSTAVTSLCSTSSSSCCSSCLCVFSFPLSVPSSFSAMEGDTVVEAPPSEPNGGESSSSCPPGKRQKLSSSSSSSPSLRPLSAPSPLKTSPPLRKASDLETPSSSLSRHHPEKADLNKAGAREFSTSSGSSSQSQGEEDVGNVKNREIIIQFFDQQTTPLGTHLAVPLRYFTASKTLDILTRPSAYTRILQNYRYAFVSGRQRDKL